MRILSVRRAFEADHSSSSYEFFAFDRLTAEQQEAVQSLTGKSPHRHLRFHSICQDAPQLAGRRNGQRGFGGGSPQ